MNPVQKISRIFLSVFVLGALSAAGCLNVTTPREISVNTDVGTREHVDAGSVPPTKTHEEARQKLADAYAEIRSLQSDVAKLERDRKDLKRERDAYKNERDDCRKEAKKYEKKMRKESGE
jgi:outer membrane murein-binding lipoprotein Lpp